MIDAHVHLGSIPVAGEKIGSFEEYKRIAEKLGIKKYCMVPIGLPENFKENSTPDNNSVLEKAEKDNQIIPVYWFNVFDLPQKIDKMYGAIKFHPDIGNVNIDDKKVIEFVKRINLPVFVHTDELKEYCNLGKLASFAKSVSVPVIAVHSGSVTRTLFTFGSYDFPENVYFETSGIQYEVILKIIYKKFGAERIIFGSDYAFGDPRGSLGRINSLDISSEEFKMITERNIMRILNLK